MNFSHIQDWRYRLFQKLNVYPTFSHRSISNGFQIISQMNEEYDDDDVFITHDNDESMSVITNDNDECMSVIISDSRKILPPLYMKTRLRSSSGVENEIRGEKNKTRLRSSSGLENEMRGEKKKRRTCSYS